MVDIWGTLEDHSWEGFPDVLPHNVLRGARNSSTGWIEVGIAPVAVHHRNSVGRPLKGLLKLSRETISRDLSFPSFLNVSKHQDNPAQLSIIIHDGCAAIVDVSLPATSFQ